MKAKKVLAKCGDGELSLHGFLLRPTGLVPEGEPTIEQWREAGVALRYIEGSIHWWIGDWLNYGEAKYGEMYTEAQEDTGLKYQTLRNDKCVAADIELSRRRDNLTWSHHAEVVGLEEDDQERFLDEAEAESTSTRDLRSRVREFKLAESRLLARDKAGLLPAGKFAVVYADPPWEYDFAETENREIENHYPTLPIEKIECLSDSDGNPVQERFADDCVLFCWTTSPKLREGLRVVDAWGFTYKTCMVWVKDKIGMGYYARQSHEILLIATRGAPAIPDPSLRPDSVIHAPRVEHSRKPDEVYEIIERMYPGFSFLELFSRSGRAGWTAWGTDV